MSDIYDFDFSLSDSSKQSMADYRGKPLLIVNTASKCGFTPQFEGLEKLHEQYADQGLVIIGFPCNQFGKQDPGDDQSISEFCQLNFGVGFPIAAKVEVNGRQAHPLFKYLKEQAPGLMGSTNIKWNFTKFLVNREGQVEQRFSPSTKPSAIENAIVGLL